MYKLENGCLPRSHWPVFARQYKMQCPNCPKSYVVLDRSGDLITPPIVCPYCGFREKSLIEKAVGKLLKIILWPL